MAFYKKSSPRTNPYTGKTYNGYSAYDHADSIAEAAEAYKRCRKQQSFILTDESPDLARFACNVCGKQMNDHGDTPEGYRGNRVDFYPKSKTFRIKHYTCAWGSLLGAICTSYSLAEAGRKMKASEGRAYKA